MSFNGSGVFAINTPGQPVVFNTIIDETVFNAFTADIASGLSNCVTRDGQSPATADLPMAGFTLTGLGAGAANGESIRYEQWQAAHPHTCEFRLTALTATPVTTADVTSAGTIYMSPYKGNRIALYDGTVWNVRTTAQISIAYSATIAADKCFDVFCYDNGGTPTLEVLEWTNDTTRATALTLQDGVLVKTGAVTRRYLGTGRSDSGGNLPDTFAKRHLWNYYNRVRRPMRVLEATNSWNYSTATIRQANAATANQLDFVLGVNEDSVSADIYILAAETGGATTGTLSFVGVGLDSTTTFDAGNILLPPHMTASNVPSLTTAHWKGHPGVGRHYLSWNERGGGVGTTTWYGDNNLPGLVQAGIHGEVWS
jgi:hypothetical protein